MTKKKRTWPKGIDRFIWEPDHITVTLAEGASADDHPYGAWGGGAKSAGGRMGGGGGFEKPDNWDSLSTQEKVTLFNASLTTVPPNRGDPDKRVGKEYGKQFGDAQPQIGVEVKDKVTGNHAAASYQNDGRIELSKSIVKPPSDAGFKAMNEHTFAHEIGHGFESQFDTANPAFTAGLGKYDAKAGKFVSNKPVSLMGGKPMIRSWKNPGEAVADTFAEYVLHPQGMSPEAKAWVEGKLAKRPNWKQSVASLRANPSPAHWAKIGSFK